MIWKENCFVPKAKADFLWSSSRTAHAARDVGAIIQKAGCLLPRKSSPAPATLRIHSTESDTAIPTGYQWDDHRTFSGHGGCGEQNYIRAARGAGLQIRLVIKSLLRKEYVDPGKILAVGQSGGGLAVLGLTEGPKPHEPLPDLRGVISTAGALGGSCARGDYLGPHFFNENMVEMYKTFGRASKTPVLMVYAKNDPRTVRAASWRDAYNESGVKAKLVVLPDQGSSPKQAHGYFYKSWSTEAWKPHFNAFLSSLGLPELNWREKP